MRNRDFRDLPYHALVCACSSTFQSEMSPGEKLMMVAVMERARNEEVGLKVIRTCHQLSRNYQLSAAAADRD